jgi:hypothetical protein
MGDVGAGRALRIRDAKMGAHLWFVLTDPDPETRKVVLVMLVTERAHTDRTVRLEVGDHPFVRHPSNVDYGTARYAPAGRLADALASGRATEDTDMSAPLLARVRAGLLASGHTPNDVADYCRRTFPA